MALSETRTETNLLWLYTNPQLERRGIDRLFEEYGNAADYDIYTGRDGFVTLTAKRLPDGERRCMTDVIERKKALFATMMNTMDCFVEEYRAKNQWVMGEHDKTRAKALAEMEDAQ